MELYEAILTFSDVKGISIMPCSVLQLTGEDFIDATKRIHSGLSNHYGGKYKEARIIQIKEIGHVDEDSGMIRPKDISTYVN